MIVETFVDVIFGLLAFGVVFLLLLLIRELRRLFTMAQVSFSVNITINPAQAPPLAVVQNPLNLTGTVGQPFTADLSSNLTGGTPPISFSVAGTPPDGLGINGSVISGTPTTAGTTTLSVTATDSGA
jgi:hypothetical protein